MHSTCIMCVGSHVNWTTTSFSLIPSKQATHFIGQVSSVIMLFSILSCSSGVSFWIKWSYLSTAWSSFRFSETRSPIMDYLRLFTAFVYFSIFNFAAFIPSWCSNSLSFFSFYLFSSYSIPIFTNSNLWFIMPILRECSLRMICYFCFSMSFVISFNFRLLARASFCTISSGSGGDTSQTLYPSSILDPVDNCWSSQDTIEHSFEKSSCWINCCATLSSA